MTTNLVTMTTSILIFTANEYHVRNYLLSVLSVDRWPDGYGGQDDVLYDSDTRKCELCKSSCVGFWTGLHVACVESPPQ